MPRQSNVTDQREKKERPSEPFASEFGEEPKSGTLNLLILLFETGVRQRHRPTGGN